MDVSRQTIGENTSSGVSIYLSFDSNSTMSSAAYKTVEAIGDLSKISVDETEESRESHQNSTLEAANDSNLKTVKKVEIMPLTVAPALKALPKNILQEYKAISSTPTKAQLLRSVDILRGSGNERGMDLGIAFMDLDDSDKSALFNEENKENAVPDCEASTISISGEIVTSVIEKKQLTLPLAEQSLKVIEETEDETCLDDKITTQATTLATASTATIDVHSGLPSTVASTAPSSPASTTESAPASTTVSAPTKAAAPTTTETTSSSPNKNASNVEKKEAATSSLGKLKSGIPQKKKHRISICEPSLHSNRPTRIASNLNRRASLVLNQKLAKNDISDIPKLLDKMLKISNSPKKNNHSKDELKTKLTENLLQQSEKRPFNFTQRMSIVLKTTLNSPARKMARKSLVSIGQANGVHGRRSALITGSSNAVKSIRRSVMPTQRKSMLPSSAQTHRTLGNGTKIKKSDGSSTSPQENDTAKNTQKTQPLVEDAVKTKPKKSPSKKSKKAEQNIFYCSVCLQQFRIKSLLDAHMYSHKEDSPPPQSTAKTKKVSPSATAHSVVNNKTNQCKYCDKKFAIVRALNIHLIQNCAKIPPAEKKKLHFSELNHVEKAQLPSVFSNANSNSSSSAAVTKTLRKANSTTGKKMNSADSLEEKQDNNPEILASDPKDSVGQMAPPQSTSKLTKKKAAHAGVYRTPSKSVPCHICKQSFKSILAYTNHSMKMHSTHPSNVAAADHRSDVDGSTLKTMRK